MTKSSNGSDDTPLHSETLDAWRVFRIISEFVEGFEKMRSIGPSVAIFGSSHSKKEDPYYPIARDLASKISKKGFSILTGGGGGIMQAANEGASLVSGISCGLCIDLPEEEPPNAFIDRKYLLRFRYFFVRKVMFVKYAKAFVVLPGGYGTLNELFEALTLIQTHKAQPFPVYLVGKSYWKGVIHWLKEVALKNDRITEKDLDLFIITDAVEEVVEGIEAHYRKVKSLENF